MEKNNAKYCKRRECGWFLKRAVAEAIERNNSQATANKEG